MRPPFELSRGRPGAARAEQEIDGGDGLTLMRYGFVIDPPFELSRGRPGAARAQREIDSEMA